MEVIVALLIFISFFVSASCGLGGSLILIPTMSLLFGIKESIVVSSILLGLNNLVKVYFFRHYIKLMSITVIMLFTFAGAAIGALLLLKMNEKLVASIFFIHLVFSFFFQRNDNLQIRKRISWLVSFLAGLFSGMVGTAGPLKGVALKCNVFNRMELVAAASVISLVSDITKSTLYLIPYPVQQFPLTIFLYSLLVMPIATALGKSLNHQLSQKAYDTFFYFIMSGYVLRLLF